MAKRLRVIADAGPLIALAKLNMLSLLKRLYGAVMISQTVYEEVVTEGLARGYADAMTVKLFWEQQKWVPVTVKLEEIPEDLRRMPLDPGETESLFLASKGKRTLLLIDEELAREAARGRGIRVKGTLGVLVEAFRQKLLCLEELEFLLAQIEQRDDIWISPQLCRQVLEEVKKRELRRRNAR